MLFRSYRSRRCYSNSLCDNHITRLNGLSTYRKSTSTCICVYSGETVKLDEPVEEADVWELVKEQVRKLLEGSEGEAGQVLEVRRDGEVVGLVVKIE